jgi:hypothetical protein
MTLSTVISPAKVLFSWSCTDDFRNEASSLVNLDQVGFWRRKWMIDLARR